jgi:hypothetical protein
MCYSMRSSRTRFKQSEDCCPREGRPLGRKAAEVLSVVGGPALSMRSASWAEMWTTVLVSRRSDRLGRRRLTNAGQSMTVRRSRMPTNHSLGPFTWNSQKPSAYENTSIPQTTGKGNSEHMRLKTRRWDHARSGSFLLELINSF